MLKYTTSLTAKYDIQLFLITEEQLKSSQFSYQDAKLKPVYNELKNNRLFKAAAGQSADVVYQKKLYKFVGLGKTDVLTPTQLRGTIRQAILSLRVFCPKSVALIPHAKDQYAVALATEAIAIGTYVWDKYQTAPIQRQPRTKFSITIIGSKTAAVSEVFTTSAGVNLARDLVNENADTANSRYLEAQVRKIIKNQKKIKLTVLNKKQLEQKKLGFILAVNKGSVNPPKLIIVQYRGAAESTPYTALVGKGLTFDTGGLNLKPTGGIEGMRMDMAGSAAVIGTLKNVLALKPKKNILFVLGVAENVTGSKSYKPGDIITGYAKKSVEVMNTDAEGRLVLADAISYVTKNYNVKTLVDIATLTGACIVALGHDYTGLMSNNDKLADQLLESAETTDDRAWRLPLYPELKQSVASKRADVSNLGQPKGAGGTITAAEFLHQFVGKTNWAHLDIAGTGFVDGPSRMYFGHGATGAGVRLLTHFLIKK